MDENLLNLLSTIDIDQTNLQIGQNTFFKMDDNGELIVEFLAKNNTKISYKIDLIKNLYTGDAVFNYEDSNWHDEYLPILICIETSIKTYYLKNSDLKDKSIIYILERLISNPDIKMTNELGIKLQNNLKLCLSLNNFSKSEVKGSLKRILKSAKRHHKKDGKTGYLDFLNNFLKI